MGARILTLDELLHDQEGYLIKDLSERTVRYITLQYHMKTNGRFVPDKNILRRKKISILSDYSGIGNSGKK